MEKQKKMKLIKKGDTVSQIDIIKFQIAVDLLLKHYDGSTEIHNGVRLIEYKNWLLNRGEKKAVNVLTTTLIKMNELWKNRKR